MPPRTNSMSRPALRTCCATMRCSPSNLLGDGPRLSGRTFHSLSSDAMDRAICPNCGQDGEGATCGSCGSSLVLEDRFRLDTELGVGTWGITYRARDLRSNDHVVVKRIDLSRARDPKQLQL